MDALAAGADRSESYRSAQRLLQEAREQLRSGADARVYHRAADAANQARDLFASSADAARRAKLARAAGGGATSPPPAVVNVAPPPSAAPPVEVESEALVSARIALQQFRRDAKSPKAAREAAKMDAQLRAHPDTLRALVREQAGREAQPSAGSVDSQTAKSTEKGGSSARLGSTEARG